MTLMIQRLIITASVLSTCIGLAHGYPQDLPGPQAYLKAFNAGTDDQFGYSAAIDGDTIVIGARFEDSDSNGVDGDGSDGPGDHYGAAYVFVRNGSSWSQEAYLKASNSDPNDFFGYSVAVSGDTIVVGAREEDSNAVGVNGNEGSSGALDSGAAYVFTRVGTTWTQQAYLKASNTDSQDQFGTSVAICGDTIVVGAEEEESNATGVDGNQSNNSAPRAGAAYVFIRTGTVWSQQAYLKASNSEPGDTFGASVDVSGDSIVVGAFFEDSNATGVDGAEADNGAERSGAAYVFTRSGSIWSQQAYLKASNTEANDSFGSSVSMDQDTVVVGAINEDSGAVGVNGDELSSGAPQSGAAYVFRRVGTSWQQEAYLKASNTGPVDQFGRVVAVSGDQVVVGASAEDGSSTGVNGNQQAKGTPSAGGTGAVYLFERNLSTWSQSAYVKATNTGGGDAFGFSADISSGSIVVGALEEDSSSTTVDGPQFNNVGFGSGAAYVYANPARFPDLCSGDGGNQMGCTDCPCLNNSPPGTIGGCLNSRGLPSRLTATGDPSVSVPPSADRDLRFHLSDAPIGALAVLISGSAVAPGSPTNPCFGEDSGVGSAAFDGLRCAIQNTRRHGARSVDPEGSVIVSTGPSRAWGGESDPMVGLAAQAGFLASQTRYFQVVHRDDDLLGCMRGLNTSQAVEVLFTP